LGVPRGRTVEQFLDRIASTEPEKSALSTGPMTSPGLIVAISSEPPSASMKAQAARSAKVFDRS
jgi:hypothetical protein